MKRTLINLVILFILAFTVIGLTSCQKSVDSENGATAETLKTDKPSGENTGKYPPVPEAMANSVIKMIDGTEFKIADKKGKVILINLWATWCGPCREEMPTLVAMHEEYQSKGFEVIGLDSDEGQSVEMIKNFAAEMKLNYPLGYADGNLFRQFVKITAMNGIPQSILINREGKMTGVFMGGGQNVLAKMKETVKKTMNE